MGEDSKNAPPVDDLVAPGPGEVELPSSLRAGERARPTAASSEVFDFDDEATRRLDPYALEAPLEAPAPERAMGAIEVQLPASVLVVDEDRRRGARTASRLMEHGYTCRVAAPGEVRAAGAQQEFDAILVELGRVAVGEELVRALSALRSVAPVVVSTASPLELGGAAEVLLLKPWLTEQAVRALEEARRRREPATADALEPPTLESELPPAVAAAARGLPVTEPSDALAPRTLPAAPAAPIQGLPRIVERPSAAVDPSAWEAFDEKVVRSRLADPVGEGFTPGRIRRASYEGALDLECRRSWAQGSAITAELSLADGRRADFSGRVSAMREGGLELRLDVDAADVPFFHAWVEESADPRVRGAEPARLVLAAPPAAPGPRAGVSGPSEGDLDALWAAAADDLDDDARQQRFIQACLASGQLDLAVRRYRALKEARPEDPRPQRYLQQVGTILGFYALKQNATEVQDSGISTRLKLALGLFVLAALALVVIAKIAT